MAKGQLRSNREKKKPKADKNKSKNRSSGRAVRFQGSHVNHAGDVAASMRYATDGA